MPKPDYVLFDPKTMCPGPYYTSVIFCSSPRDTACKGSAPVAMANCLATNQNNAPEWVVDGDAKQSNITLHDATNFKGDVYVDRLDVSELSEFHIGGCLYNYEEKTMDLVVSPLRAVLLIFHGKNCKMPAISLVPKYDPNDRCQYTLSSRNVGLIETESIYSIHYIFASRCESVPLNYYANDSKIQDVSGIVLLMVTIGFCTTLGISIYVVRRYKQKKRSVVDFKHTRIDNENTTL